MREESVQSRAVVSGSELSNLSTNIESEAGNRFEGFSLRIHLEH